ncbi:L protein [Wenling frogfish arenavirus 2]|uniref:RNA-directed RNA polymerase L n=1 Tax=Wenling frogfish arenavirus 2 TaxID=2116467 RepID=A0A2P1GNQ8_9VIRU|nr:L protein [Wenling frogfish arenavirus 2]AVM87645.1 L protein [Wenling frogfish arenavirus 2]
MDWSKPIRQIRTYSGNCPLINSAKNWVLGRGRLHDLNHECKECRLIIKHPSMLLKELGEKISPPRDKLNMVIREGPIWLPSQLRTEEELGVVASLEKCSRIIGCMVENALCQKNLCPYTPEEGKLNAGDIFKKIGHDLKGDEKRLTPDSYVIEDGKVTLYEFGFARMKYIKERDDKIKWIRLPSDKFTLRVETMNSINECEAFLTTSEFEYLKSVSEIQDKCRNICRKCNFWSSYDSLIAATNDGVRLLDVPNLVLQESGKSYDERYKEFMNKAGCSNEIGPLDNYELYGNYKTGWKHRSDLASSLNAYRISSVEECKKKLNSLHEKIPIPSADPVCLLFTQMRKILEKHRPSMDMRDEVVWKRYSQLLWEDNELPLLPGSNDSIHTNRKLRRGMVSEPPTRAKKLLKKWGSIPVPAYDPVCISSLQNLLEKLNSDRSDRVNRVKEEVINNMVPKPENKIITGLDIIEMRPLPETVHPCQDDSTDEFFKYCLTMNPFEEEAIKRLKELKEQHHQSIPLKQTVARMGVRLCTPTYRTPGAIAFYQSSDSMMIVSRSKSSKSRTFWVSGTWEKFKCHPERLFPLINFTEALLMCEVRASCSGVKLNERALCIVSRIYEHQSKGCQEMLQNMRYFWMACKSEFHRDKLVDKLSCTVKNRIEWEVASLIKKWMIKNADLPAGRYHSFLNDEEMEENMEFSLLEIYLCHLITKRDSSEGISLMKCFEKFLAPKMKYDPSMSGRLLSGKLEQEIQNEMFGDNLPLYSRSLFTEFLEWITARHKIAVKSALTRLPEPTLSLVANPKSTVVRAPIGGKVDEKLKYLINSKLNLKKIKGECITGATPTLQGDPTCDVYSPKEGCECFSCQIGRECGKDSLISIASHAENSEFMESCKQSVAAILESMEIDEILSHVCKIFYDEDLNVTKRRVGLQAAVFKLCHDSLKEGDHLTTAGLLLLKMCRKRKKPGGKKKEAIQRVEDELRRIGRRTRYSSRTTTSAALKSVIDSEIEDPHILACREASPDFNLYFSIANKEQIGGPRELFIGDLNTKLITRRLEEVCRGLTPLFSSSCLNNPEREDSFRDLLKTSLTQCRSQSILCMTLDHSKWGPTQCVDAFIYLIMELAGEQMGIHVDDLKRHMMKRVEIPFSCSEAVMKKVILGQPLKPHEEHIKSRLMQGEPWINSVFDMGQGILHNHSDLLGCMTEEFICEKSCRKTEEKLGLEMHSITVKSMNTSDDSCLFAQCSNPHLYWKKTFIHYHSLFSELMNKKISPKSTCDSKMAEFKSRFVKRDTEVPAVFKFTSCVLHGLNMSNVEQLSNTSLSLSVNAFNQGASVEECRLVQSVFFKLIRFITPEVNLNITLDQHCGLICLPTPDEMMILNHESIVLKEIFKRMGLGNEAFMELDTGCTLLSQGKIKIQSLIDSVSSILVNAKRGQTCLPEATLENYSPIRPYGRGADREMLHHLKGEMEKARAVKDPKLRKIQKYLDGKGASHNLRSLRRSLILSMADNISGCQENLMQSLLTLIYQTRGKFYKGKDELKSLKDSLREGIPTGYIVDKVLNMMLSTPWAIRQLSAETFDSCNTIGIEQGHYSHFSRDPNWADNFIPEVIDCLKEDGGIEAMEVLSDCGVKLNRKYKRTEEKKARLEIMFHIGEICEVRSSGECCLRRSDDGTVEGMIRRSYMTPISRLPCLTVNSISPSTTEMMVESFLSVISVCTPGVDVTPELIDKVCMCISMYLGRTEHEFMQSLMSYDNPSALVKMCRMMIKTRDSSVSLRDIMTFNNEPVKMIDADVWGKNREHIRRVLWELPSSKGRVKVHEKIVDSELSKITITPLYFGLLTKEDEGKLFSESTLLRMPERLHSEFRRILDRPLNCKVKVNNSITQSDDIQASMRLKLCSGTLCQITSSIMTKEQKREFFYGKCDDITGCREGEPLGVKTVYEMKFFRSYVQNCLRASAMLGWDLCGDYIETMERRVRTICEVYGIQMTDNNIAKLFSECPDLTDVLSDMSVSATGCKRDIEDFIMEMKPEIEKRLSLITGRLFTRDGLLVIGTREGKEVVSPGSRAYRRRAMEGRSMRHFKLFGRVCLQVEDSLDDVPELEI